jgi:hypothetical protein
MTLAMLHADPGGAGRGSREPPPRRRRRPWPHLVAAIVTAACVCGGFAVVTWTVPRAPTPGNVARAFAEARMHQDWATMWQLQCRAVRLPDQQAFVARMTALDEAFLVRPAVGVFVRGISQDDGATRPSFTVTVETAAFYRDGATWTSTVRLPVVREEGEFRVCFGLAGSEG